MTERSHRLSILSAEELDDLYSPPRFTDKDRDLYFQLSEREYAIASERRGAAGVYFVLLLGYFRAKNQFFDVAAETSQEDVRYIVGRHFPAIRERLLVPPSRPTLQSLQDDVLEVLGFRRWAGTRSVLVRRLKELAMRSTQPRYLVREAISFLERERIALPAYSHLQDLIGAVVTCETERLTRMLKDAMPAKVRKQLDALTQPDGSAYRITMLKQDLRDFTYKALRTEVERRKIFAPLHAFATTFLARAAISTDSSKYYSSLVMYYTTTKLQRMAPLQAKLYLLCFCYHRYRQVNDHLVEAFVARVDTYTREARAASEEAMKQAVEEGAKSLFAAGNVLSLFVDESVADNAYFADVRKKAYAYLAKDRIPVVADYLRNIAFDKTAYQWKFYADLSATFKKNLRHLFIQLEFTDRVEDDPLMRAVTFLKGHLAAGRAPRQVDPTTFPTDFIPRSLRRYIFVAGGDGKRELDVDRWEFVLYRELCNAVSAGNIFVRESNEYRSFEDDLIDEERWKKEKHKILDSLDAPILRIPIQITLDALRLEIEEKFKRVNGRIQSRNNAHIELHGKTSTRWKLVYPKEEPTLDGGFYSQLPIVGVADLLKYVAAETDYRDAFTHQLDRYGKQALDPPHLDAALVAMGTNMGLFKMAEVARLRYSTLVTTARNYLRQETLRDANDVIANATAKLPAFKLFNIHDKLHSSSDGQRFETQVDTAKARHSVKYFGLKKGISVCTVVANHLPINAAVIGAHEHESHYLFDLLFNNTSDVRPEQHSTDTHGTNQINFWLLRAFGYRFAPRYKDIRSKTDSLVGFHHPSHYGDVLIKPCRKVNEGLIVSEWPNILRIMASLGQKEVSQATIVRKLSSYDLQNNTKKALWELDSLHRTLYILDYIDDVELRQSVQKALNRGEAFHKFRRAIAYVNSGKFRVQTEAQQKIWNDCARLIANSVIYYNTALLSRIYENKLAEGDAEAIALLQSISPIAWQNVNLYGNFEFSDSAVEIDLDMIARTFGDPGLWGVVESNLELEAFD
jgi:TnpA family transposase